MNFFLKCSLGIFLICFLLFSSCGTRKNMVYLQPDSSSISAIYQQFIPRIQPQDILTVAVTASDPKAVIAFNSISGITPSNITQQVDMALRPTYTVDNSGYINLPMLGKVHVAGLTRLEAIEKIRGELTKYIKDPGVNINYNNFRISVLGEVAHPGSFIVPTERITVLDALGMAGDMTIRGLRTNVMVVREKDGQKSIHRLDMTKQETLNSPYYYLAQNDIIYVEPNKAQINNSKLGANSNIIVSIAGLIITVISVLTR